MCREHTTEWLAVALVLSTGSASDRFGYHAGQLGNRQH